ARRGHHRLVRDRDEGIELCLRALDAGEDLIRVFDRRQLLGADGARCLAGGQEQKVAHARTQVSEKARKAVLLCRPANCRGTGWPFNRRPLTAAWARPASRNRLNSQCLPVADCSGGTSIMKGSLKPSQARSISRLGPVMRSR